MNLVGILRTEKCLEVSRFKSLAVSLSDLAKSMSSLLCVLNFLNSLIRASAKSLNNIIALKYTVQPTLKEDSKVQNNVSLTILIRETFSQPQHRFFSQHVFLSLLTHSPFFLLFPLSLVLPDSPILQGSGDKYSDKTQRNVGFDERCSGSRKSG